MGCFGSLELIWVIWGLLFVSCHSFSSNEVWALTAFKEAIYEDPHLVLSSWNSLDADPCNWKGISCSNAQDHVISLNLHGNNLLGTIPKEIGMLEKLTVLDLGLNRLSGPIPPEIGNLISVTKINLRSNGLTGSVPPELGKLRNLIELRLDRNKLQGTVPGDSHSNFTSNMHGMYASNGNATGLCRSSQLKAADFSYNFFVGRIPPCLNYLPRSNFRGNCLWDTNTTQRSSQKCGETSPANSHPGGNLVHRQAEHGAKHHHTSKPHWLLALEIITGTVASLLMLCAIVTACKKCKGSPPVIIPWKKPGSTKDHRIIYIDTELLKDAKKWSRQELEVACEDFSNIIGSSPDSLLYKGVVKDGPEIAVKSLCIKEEYWTGYLEFYFQREVADLARINHENTGKLLGYCRESNPFSRMLVFEYASNGTLYEHLHYGEGCQLSWARRMKVIIGIARGLKYMHTELDPPFTISELSSNAVYLTEEFSPKLVDFENWKIVYARSGKNLGSIGNDGDVNGFPDSIEPRHLDVQGNIFAFGIVLLEIISGRPPYCKDRGCLVDWAREYLESPELLSYLADPELRHFRYDDLKVISEVANLCLQTEPSKRPSMKELCLMLENEIDISISAELRQSPLAWAELAISS